MWGLLNALYQIVGALTQGIRSKLRLYLEVEEDSVSCRGYQQIITFGLSTFAWVFFRADSVRAALLYIWRMFTQFHIWSLITPEAFGDIPFAGFVLMAVHLVAVMRIDSMGLQGRNVIKELRSLHFFHRWGIYALLIMDLIVFGMYGGYDPTAFLYGGY